MNLTYKIKTALLHYLRFSIGAFVATEVSYNYGTADVLYIPKRKEEIREVEIKVSKGDFLNEWKKKEHKHKCLNSNVMNNMINYFYFCVPVELKDFALEQLKDKQYGLLVYEERWNHKNKLQEKLDLIDCITVAKTPKKLYTNKPIRFEYFKDQIALRAMSDLATLYKLQYFDGDKKTRFLIRDKKETL